MHRTSRVQTAGFSDHSLVFVVIRGQCYSSVPSVSKFRSFRSFQLEFRVYFHQHFNEDAFNEDAFQEDFKEDLRNIDWSEFDQDHASVDELWNSFKSIFNHLSDKHAPHITVR